MPEDLINLLNSAASNDPNTVIVAGQQLLLLTASCDPSNKVYEKLATVVFTSSDNRLTPDGRFVGLIHLKNLLFDPQIWKSLEASERNAVRHSLLNYLASGSDPSILRNNIEVLPRIGSCVTTLVARLVHNDWLKEEWSDELWEQLINWCAWSSLRSGLRAAASYRLPARRKVFLNLIRNLLPNLLNLWETSLVELHTSALDSAIRLSRLLYTCLTAPGLQPNSGPFLLDQDFLPLTSRIFEHSFATLDKLCTFGPGVSWTAEHAQLARRMTKLILAATMVSSPELRGKNVKDLLLRAARVLSHQMVRPQLCAKSMTWILALIYGLMSSKACDSGAKLPLDPSGSNELHKCLFQSSSYEGMYPSLNQSDTLLFSLLRNLLPTAFLLSPVEVLGITSNPEGCIAAGGSCVTVAGTNSSENVSAAAIWDVDMQAQDLIRADLQSLLGFHGSEQQVPCFQPCRQLTELIVTLMLRHYESEGRNLLLNLVENMRDEASNPVQYEALMRLTQLVLPYTALDPQWNSLSNWLLSSGLTFVHSHLPVLDDSDEARLLVVLISRTLCLLMRCALHSIPAEGDQGLGSQCTAALAQLTPYLNAGSEDGVQIRPHQLNLCVRLAAAHCVAWCVNQPVFPSESLTTHLGQLFHGLRQLIYDVSECETRVYLLNVLCSLLELTDVMGTPELVGQMMALLDELWQLETQTTALRSSILDAVCLLQTVLNSSDEIDPRLTELQDSLQAPLALLITAALEDDEASGSEALFEPGLRLWRSMVSGPRATWSGAVKSLLPLLVGQDSLAQLGGDSRPSTSTREPLIDRLDSLEQAELFFGIAEGYLDLVCRTDVQTKCDFLARWTEPFWAPVLAAAIPKLRSGGGSTSLDYLYSHAASVTGDDDGQQDCESLCRLKQLRLCTTWLSACLDTVTSGSPMTPSLVGLLVLAARHALLRAPVNPHDDVCPRATQMELSLLARLVLRQSYWPHYLHILNFLCTNQGNQNSFNASLCLPTVDWPALDFSSAVSLVQVALERWIARADSLSEPIDRRCYALACLQSLAYCAQPYFSEHSINSPTEDQLEQWALQDTTHVQWLEPVINLCIQVLFEEVRRSSEDQTVVYIMHPAVLATDEELRKSMLAAFSSWQDKVGGEPFANALLRCHVDPALIGQLQTQLRAG